MNDSDALALCAYQEAVGEQDDGVAAIVRVILNRTRLGYASDGTVQGTIFRHAQFSWTEFAMVAGHYTRVCETPDQVADRAAQLLAQSQAQAAEWARVTRIVEAVQAKAYAGLFYDQLTDDAVLYLNPAVSAQQAWEVPANLVCRIGHHVFYRDPPRSGPIVQPVSFAQAATKTALA